MAKVVGDIAVTVGADVSGLEAGMQRAGRAVKGFDKSAAAMAKRMANVGTAVAAAVAAIGVAGVGLARSAASSAKEIDRLSKISGVGAQQFQRLAAAGDTLGFSAEKMADIFKDVNDKFGDFMANGAGPLKDFFDNIAPQVGVTAEQFARLSGPEALQLYVSSLERAGVSQQQMTFYMEALANDATGLIPLLRDNGSEMQRLGDNAERAGRVMSDKMVRDGAQLDNKLREIGDTLRSNLNRAILENSDEILALANDITEVWIPALTAVAGFIGDVVGALATMIKKIGEGIGAIRRFAAETADAIGVGSPTTGSAGRRGAQGLGSGRNWDPGPSRRSRVTGAGFRPASVAPLELNPITVFGGGGGGGSSRSGGGGGGGGLSRDQFEAFQMGLATEAERLEEWRQEQLEKLREFRDAKLATEAEFNDAETRIMHEHAERLRELEGRAQQARLQEVSGALGELASLMQTGNDKLFKIGQAAAIAQAIVDGYSAATSAWAKGMAAGGPPLAAAYTAASLAKTGSLISGIRGAGSSGGGGALAGAGPSAPSQTPLEVRFSGINPNELYSGSSIRTLFERLQDEAGDRGLSLTFAR
jgi:hypothetical protein